MAEFREASQQVYDMLVDLIDKNHKNLSQSIFKIMMRDDEGNWESKGKTIYIKMKILSRDIRFAMKADVMVHINKWQWEHGLTVQQKRFILDNELESLDIQFDEEGNEKFEKDGRPKLSRYPYAFEGNLAALKRYGLIMPEMKKVGQAMAEARQMNIYDFINNDKDMKKVVEFRMNPEKDKEKVTIQ